MRASSFEKIINTSITQSLSRTLITSATTLLAVIPLYIFATGSIKLFALNLIIGIVVGTYSSIFIASPILLSLVKRANIKKAKHLGREILDAEEIDTEAAEAFALVKEDVEIPRAERKKKGKRQRRK
jgi:preprotein translocase subunit SecF